MNSNQYRTQLAQATDDDLRYEFLRLIAQEGRQHYMTQIAEVTLSDSFGRTPLRVIPGNKR